MMFQSSCFNISHHMNFVRVAVLLRPPATSVDIISVQALHVRLRARTYARNGAGPGTSSVVARKPLRDRIANSTFGLYRLQAP